MNFKPIVDPAQWNSALAALPARHVLQSWEWGQFKSRWGWTPRYCLYEEIQDSRAAALVLKRTLSRTGLSILYVPKGPALDYANAALVDQVLPQLAEIARRDHAIFIKLDPDVALGAGVPGTGGSLEFPAGEAVRSELLRRGWLFSQDQIQFRNTVLVDLSPSEEELLARMKQKTRYNIRLAQKKGVTVRVATPQDLPLLYRMYAETSVRDGFLIRAEGYYQTVWRIFGRSEDASHRPSIPFSEPLIAEVNGEPVAAVSLFYFAGQAVYLFGMSREQHREKMPNYLLQWEAIRRARALGCRTYNLWGAPNDFNEQDHLWGVFRFKEGLGGEVLRTLGAWDFTPSPLLYKLYTEVLPRLLDVMRTRGKARTRQSLGA